MTLFDFVADDDFRKSLSDDFREMNISAENSALKAVHVLAGSIVEAVLVDYLISEGLVSKDKGLKMDLAGAISLAKDSKVISATTADLSSVVRGYRNLIHPGRAIRLKEQISPESADVAKALVSIVLNEVESKKRENYGFTAAQIVSKIEKDSSAGSIIQHLISEANDTELERLLMSAVPDAYSTAYHEQFTMPHVLPGYILCFRTAFNHADEELKRKVARRFVVMIKQESDEVILPYGTAFVRGSDLEYLEENDATLVVQHFVGRMQDGLDRMLIDALAGIGTHLRDKDVVRFVDPFIRIIAGRSDSELGPPAEGRLLAEWRRMPIEIDSQVTDRIEDWIRFYDDKDMINYSEQLRSYKARFDEIPF